MNPVRNSPPSGSFGARLGAGAVSNGMNIREFVHARKYLFWSTKNYDGLNNEAIVEAVLNYGDWEDVKTLIGILGIEEVARVFRAETNRPRVNYNKRVVHYFQLFFQRYA